MAIRRIQKELGELIKNPLPNLVLCPVAEEDLFHWKAQLIYEGEGPYRGGIFDLDILLQDYPFKPPKIKFETRIYHCNISFDGEICLNVLKPDQWKPATKLMEVMQLIMNLMENPNPDDPLDTDAADLYRNDPRKYMKNAKDWTKKFAKPVTSESSTSNK